MIRTLVVGFALLAGACAELSSPRPVFDLTRFQTPDPEFGLTRGPDGWYLSRMTAAFGTDASSRIWHYPFGEGEPSLAAFGSATSDERDFSWDPTSQMGCFVRQSDIWCMPWSKDAGWGPPEKLPSPINTDGYEASPHFDTDGSLYFASQRAGGMGQGDIYRARKVGDAWEIELLGGEINSPTGEWNLSLSPDGSMMVFEASGRETNRTASGDFYLSCRVSGRWQAAKPMDALNTDGSDLDFRFSGPREGFFTSATIGGDGILRYAGAENFIRCN